MAKKSKTPIGAMTFCTGDLKEAWGKAERFAGEGGRVASMPDVIAARLVTTPHTKFQSSTAWDSYIGTTSAEYAGYSRGGIPILIVAHGVGPMSTLKGALTAYKHCNRDSRPGGRISYESFLKLESGAYGDVSIVSLDRVCERHEYPFMGGMTLTQLRYEHLMQARLGPAWYEYGQFHEKLAIQSRKDNHPDADRDIPTLILEMDDASGCHYALNHDGKYSRPDQTKRKLEYYPELVDRKEALGHLLVMSQLMNMHYSEYRVPQLVSEVGLHSASNHNRMLGIRADADLSTIAAADSGSELIQKHWRDLLLPCKGKAANLRRIVEFPKNAWFTQTVKTGHNMDTGIPEHPVRSMVPVGKPVTFTTKIEGYYGFLRYDLKEVAAVAPEGANVYVLGDTGFVGEDHHKVNVTFYKADVDTKTRVMTSDELEADFDLFVKLSTAG